MAFAAVAVPWGLFLAGGIGTLAEALAPAALWAALWPVLLGGLLAVALRLLGHRLPRVPEGDVVAVAERLTRTSLPWGDALVRADAALRQWPIAGLSLLAITVILGVALFGQMK
jgi:hypothetical protein